MLNYKEMSIKFDNLLKEVTKESYEAWVVFDDFRSIASRIQNGEKVKIWSDCHSNEVEKIKFEKPTENVGFLFYNKMVCLQYGATKK